jgi:hypothetical protein
MKHCLIVAMLFACAERHEAKSAPPPLLEPAALTAASTFTAASGAAPSPATTVAPLGSINANQVFANIAIEVDGKHYTFNKACEGFTGPAGSARAGARLSPGRAPWLWMRGCDGQYATFYAGMNRPPETGISPVSIFDLRIPGLETQELGSARANTKSKEGPQPVLATFEVTSVSATRIAGKFTFEARTTEGGAFKSGTGTFDLPRNPDDTSRGP